MVTMRKGNGEKIFLKLKRKFGLWIIRGKHGIIGEVLIKLNQQLFHRNDYQKELSYGTENPDMHFFVIRPIHETEGLLSLCLMFLRAIWWCEQQGYIPIIDMKNYDNQYLDVDIHSTDNAWEYYFDQPTEYNLERVCRCKHVIISGYDSNYGRTPYDDDIDGYIDRSRIHEQSVYFRSSICIKEEIINEANNLILSLNIENACGLFIRGTDYVALKLGGLKKQPTLDKFCEKIDEYIDKYNPDRFFLVTEDYNNYLMIKKRYGGRVVTIFDNYARNYDGKGYISESFDGNGYQRGKEYLIRILMLSKCQWLIASQASGSHMALILNDNHYEDKYVFDLGRYDE